MAGTVATTSSVLVRPAAGFRVHAEPETSNAAPSGTRPQARGTERVISPAHLLGRCGVSASREDEATPQKERVES